MFYTVTIAHNYASDPHGEDDGQDVHVDAADREAAESHPDVLDAIERRSLRTGAAQMVLRVCQRARWVNAYSIGRCFGGHEEGGWWYDWYECLASMPVEDESEAEAIKEMMAKNLGWENEHDRYSVLGSDDFRCYVEDQRASSESNEVPHYC